MVNTKVIRQPSQSLLSYLLLYLSLHHPPFSLFFLSPHRITLNSPALSPSLSSLSLTLAPPPPVSLPEPDTHRILFFLTLPTPILNSQFVVLSLRLSLFLYSLGRFSIAFAAAAASGGAPIGLDSPRLLASLEYLVGVVFVLFHVSISSGIGRTEL